MDNDTILKYYWDVFISHVCQFYQLDEEFIEFYANDIDMHSLSKNKKLKWNFDFIEKWADYLFWDELAWNEAINWDLTSINIFKEYFDLNKEWYRLGQNKSLVISEDLILKYKKKLQISTNNPTWTEELRNKYPENQWPPYKHGKKKPLDFSNLDKVFSKLEEHGENNEELYEKVFLPIIKETSLLEIFNKKIDYSQRFYYLKAIERDEKGITPQFEFKDESPFRDYYKRGLFDIKKDMILVNTGIQEGQDRLYEIPNFDGYCLNSILLISENIKLVGIGV